MIHLNSWRFLALLLALAVAFSSPAEAARKKHHASRAPVDRYAAIVIDAETGYVYTETNADKHLYPASLTKMMTLYLAFDAIEAGKLSRNDMIYVSSHAARQEPSSLGLAAGERIRVQDCILGIATKSANDCAVALGEALGNSEGRFARMMTNKARELGMKNTNFVNASGLFKPQQYSSARDMAILARALIQNHPKYYRYFSTESFTYNGNTFLNHNHLMSTYRGMDGLKTGYVYASGYNLAASAVRNGTRLIGVVFGGRTAKSRNNAMAQLLDNAFAEARHAPARVASATPPEETAEQAQRGVPVATEQGDTSEGFVEPAAAPKSAEAGWAIQIGSYASHAAGTKALAAAKAKVRRLATGTDTIAPLMTRRGMVYRARLFGLDRVGATQACRILKGSCIVLSIE